METFKVAQAIEEALCAYTPVNRADIIERDVCGHHIFIQYRGAFNMGQHDDIVSHPGTFKICIDLQDGTADLSFEGMNDMCIDGLPLPALFLVEYDLLLERLCR